MVKNTSDGVERVLNSRPTGERNYLGSLYFFLAAALGELALGELVLVKVAFGDVVFTAVFLSVAPSLLLVALGAFGVDFPCADAFRAGRAPGT